MQKFFPDNPQAFKDLKDENEVLANMLYDMFETAYLNKSTGSFHVTNFRHFDIAKKLKQMGLIQKEPVYLFHCDTQLHELLE